MQITIYLDIIFLINFVADFFVLYITGRILNKRIIFWKVVLGALVEATVLLFFLLFPSTLIGWRGIAISIGVSMGAVVISYGGNGFSVLRTWFLSTTILTLIGGVMNYLKYLFHLSTLQILQWFFLFVLSSVVILLGLEIIKKTIRQSENLYLIQIKIGERVAVETVYMDTGNFLLDPIFQKPVIVLNENVICKCLMKDEIDIIREYKDNGRLDYNHLLSCQAQKKMCFHEITFQSMGNLSGRMLCVLADEVSILGRDKVLHRQPVAVAPELLFEGKTYQGLLHKECI